MRKAGVLLPIFSLSSAGGIGTLGQKAHQFVRFLADAGQSLWQVLPLGPTGYGNSPYQSFCAFAGNHYFIDLDVLARQGYLKKEEYPGQNALPKDENPEKVDYDYLKTTRLAILEKAVQRQNKAHPAYRAFCAKNAHWLKDYALYMAIKEHEGDAGFANWPLPLRSRQPQALKAAAAQFAPRAEFWQCLQYFFYMQWAALKKYANGLGVGIVGDIPIYVSDDSSDLWANPGLFCLDENARPLFVAGVPPDDFAEDGQLWGNPLYNWKEHRKTKYAWWIARLSQASCLFDVTRIDHFRGFCDYFAIDFGQASARDGRWIKGPGLHFVRAVQKALPKLQIIAEDLGILSPQVHKLLLQSGYPGMKILQFAFDSQMNSDYLPHKYSPHCAVYTGTHDNTTSRAWQSEVAVQELDFAKEYLHFKKEEDAAAAFINAALASVANTAIIPMQDWLNLGAQARINKPSTLGHYNWSWRLSPAALSPQLAKNMRRQTQIYGRLQK